MTHACLTYVESGNSDVLLQGRKNRFKCHQAEKRIVSGTCFLEQFSQHWAVNTGRNFSLFVHRLKTKCLWLYFGVRRMFIVLHLSGLRTVMRLGSPENSGIPACSLDPDCIHTQVIWLRVTRVVRVSLSVRRALQCKKPPVWYLNFRFSMCHSVGSRCLKAV